MSAAAMVWRVGRGLLRGGSVAAHLGRGLIAAACLAWAFGSSASHPMAALAAAAAAVVAMRGCPLCWTLGLCEAIGRSRTTQR